MWFLFSKLLGKIDCQWSSWSQCTKSCGTGIQFRTILVQAQYGGQVCTGLSQRDCNTQSCIGNLNKITFGTKATWGCGADPGVKIYIQKPNDNYCSVPLPIFFGGETKTLIRGNLTGDCKSVYFEAGRESINFWIYSKEFACVNSLTLRFSTSKGQVTFLANNAASGDYYVYGTTSNGIINSVKKQSRKFKIFLCRNKKCIRQIMCNASEMTWGKTCS